MAIYQIHTIHSTIHSTTYQCLWRWEICRTLGWPRAEWRQNTVCSPLEELPCRLAQPARGSWWHFVWTQVLEIDIIDGFHFMSILYTHKHQNLETEIRIEVECTSEIVGKHIKVGNHWSNHVSLVKMCSSTNVEADSCGIQSAAYMLCLLFPNLPIASRRNTTIP